ncbi:XkdX family protein [Lacrimispora sp.]|nr:XkdX family protein [Lacrimispora sp.]
MSKNFERVKSFYTEKLWPLSWVENAVGKWITESEFQEIIGKAYKE